MGWVLRLVESGVEGSAGSVDVLEIDGPGDLRNLADLGLKLAQGKQLLSQVQQAVVAAQCRDIPPNGRHAGPAVPHAGSRFCQISGQLAESATSG